MMLCESGMMMRSRLASLFVEDFGGITESEVDFDGYDGICKWCKATRYRICHILI